MIKEIIIKNLKGNIKNQPLTGLDIFCGKNGVGKSSRLEAVAISLLGYIPGQGKKPEETFKCSSAGSMTVGLKTDNDFEFTRSFDKKVKDGKSTISQTINLSPSLGEKTGKDKEARIIEEIGNFPIMLDFNEFLNLPDSKRRDFFFNLSGGSDLWGKTRIEEILKKTLITEDAKKNEEFIEYLLKGIENSVKKYSDRFDIQQGLTAMLEYSKDQLSYWKSEKEIAEGAAVKLADLKNQLTETDRNIVENKELLEKHQQDLIKIEKELSATYEKKKVITSRNDKIDALNTEIGKIENENPPGDEESLLTQISESESKIKLHDYETEIKQSQKMSKNLNSELENITKKMQAVTDEGKALGIEKKTLEDAMQEIKKVEGRCVINSQIKCDKDFSKFIEAKKSKIDELSLSIIEKRKEYETLKKESDEQQGKIKIEEGIQENLASSERLQSQTNDIIRKSITDLQIKLNDVKSFEKFKIEKLEAKNKELEDLINTPVEAIAPTEIMEKQKTALQGNIQVLKFKIQEQETSRVTLSNQQSASIDVKIADYNVEVYKQLRDALGPKGIQGEIVKEMLDPIKEDIQNNLSLMGINNKFFFQMESDSGREIFQFGWTNHKGYKVNFDTINNAHKSLLLVAILTAIVEKANPKLKLLAIDDVEHIIDELFETFTNGLTAIAHKWDNIILAVAHSNLQVEGFKVWNLSQEAAS